MWWNRRRNAKSAIPPCCLEYQRRTGTGTKQKCPQFEQRTAADYDHGLRLQGTNVLDNLRDAFGAGGSGPERTWSFDTPVSANPDDGSTTDIGNPSAKADATTRWLSEHGKGT